MAALVQVALVDTRITKVVVSFSQRDAVVTCDDARTRAKAVTNAAANADCPSTVKQAG